jgi:hypothetical protein
MYPCSHRLVHRARRDHELIVLVPVARQDLVVVRVDGLRGPLRCEHRTHMSVGDLIKRMG